MILLVYRNFFFRAFKVIQIHKFVHLPLLNFPSGYLLGYPLEYPRQIIRTITDNHLINLSALTFVSLISKRISVRISVLRI